MIEPMYKKGSRLAWIGFGLVIIYAFVAVLGGSIGGSGVLVPSLQPLVPVAALADLVGIVLMFWGSVLDLKSKNRSLWWLLLFLLALSGAGVIFIGIIFMLKDKSVSVPAPTTSNPVSNTSNIPQ